MVSVTKEVTKMNGLEKKELLQEICSVLKDEFVVKITTDDNSIVMNFLNGQKFKLELTEM